MKVIQFPSPIASGAISKVNIPRVVPRTNTVNKICFFLETLRAPSYIPTYTKTNHSTQITNDPDERH